ncbi:RRP12-like protein [Gracilariopsis chorda]|uniref:RRP12-like protein n=1 Tax=Gracilariopsis chorda TaxID=448386 RepID=A0A2V3IVZ2_9FLOR|nr:RRP12-like protein [Gracilariopsis chorda]|eukprot:PXF46304.1 RRP12-like protein [Gracilariopsis chorda]
MVQENGHPASLRVADLASALPTATTTFRRHRGKGQSKPMPPSLPECFAEIWRRRKSTLPAHRRERASLEAVASTIPEEARSFSGEAAAAAYLAALIVSLERLVASTKPAISKLGGGGHVEKMTKKQRKKLKKKEQDAEQSVRDMTVPELMTSAATGAHDKDQLMKDDDQKDVESNEDIDLISSLVFLAGLAASACSQAVLNAKAEHVVDVVMRALDHVAGHHTVARHSSAVFSTVLAVLGSSSWSNPKMQRAYLYLLRQTADADSKTRRRAREALTELLSSPRAAIIRAKTSSTMTAHYVNELKVYEEFFSSTVRDVGGAALQVTSLIHLLTSVELYSIFLNPSDAAKVAKELVVIAAKNQSGVTSFAFQALTNLLNQDAVNQDHSGEGDVKSIRIPLGDLNKLMLAILQHNLPDDPSDDLKQAYVRCLHIGSIVHSSYFEYSSPSKEFILKPVQRVFDMVTASTDTKVTRSLCGTLRDLVIQKWFSGRADVLRILEGFLKTTFKSAWGEVFPVLKTYLENDMAAGSSSMSGPVRKLLQTLLKKRQAFLDSKDRKGQDAIQSLIASIARGGGAVHLVDLCKLEYDDKEHITHAWMLTLLRDNLRGAPISLFEQVFIPLTSKLGDKLTVVSKQKRVVEAKNIANYISQIWRLFPPFCTKPSDLSKDGALNTAFQAIYTCLTHDDQLIMYPIGVGGLRQLSVSVEALPSEGEERERTQSSFTSRLKKLYPVLLTVSEKVSEERRRMLLEAITVACRATRNPIVVTGLLRKSIRRLLELQAQASTEKEKSSSMSDSDSQVSQKQHAAADIAIAIAESKIMPFDASEVSFLEKALNPFFFNPKESSLQKKAYRASTLLLSLRNDSPSQPECQQFLSTISAAGDTVAPGAKARRQSLISALVQQSLRIGAGAQRTDYLQGLNDRFLSEVVLGTRDVSERTRAASFETLIALGRNWNLSSPGKDFSGLQNFFFAVAAGLGGRTVQMLSSTLTALGRLIYDFRGEAVASESFRNVVDSLFASTLQSQDVSMTGDKTKREEKQDSTTVQPGPIAILLRHNDLEVQKAALGVIKVATKALAEPSERISAILRGILPGLVHVAARSKKQEIRLRVRVILERLLRRCGYEMLQAAFPSEHLKLLSAVRKKHSRDLVKKHAAKDRRRELEASKLENSNAGHVKSGDELDDSDSDVEREILDGDELIENSRASTFPKTEDEQPSDFLNLLEDGVGNVEHGRKGLQVKSSRTKEKGGTGDVIKYATDGRLILVESDDDSGVAELGSVSESSDEEGEHGMQRKLATKVTTGKRGRPDAHESGRQTKRLKGSFGDEYRSRRGAGDVKRAGRPDPYAYVPLGMEMMGPGARPGLIGARRNRKGSSLSALVATKGKKKRWKSAGIPGKR